MKFDKLILRFKKNEMEIIVQIFSVYRFKNNEEGLYYKCEGEKGKSDFKAHIAIKICICYNANRQKEITSPFGQKNESPDRIAVQFGDSSCLL